MSKKDSSKKKDGKNRLRLFCSECGYRFPPDLISLVNSGTVCYCEKCGTKISPKSLGIGKTSSTEDIYEDESPSYSKTSTTYEQKLKSFEQYKSHHHRHKSPDRLKHLDNWIQNLNSISVPFGVFFLVVGTISTISGLVMDRGPHAMPMFWYLLVALFLGIATIQHDQKIFKPAIEKGDYSSRGIQEFIWGVIGCIGFGTGAIIMLKSFFLMGYTGQDTEKYPRLSSKTWARKVITVLNDASWRLCGLLLVPMIGVVSYTLTERAGMGPLQLMFLIFLVVTTLVDAAVIRPKLAAIMSSPKDEPVKADLGVYTIALGIIGCIAYGAGTLVLIKGLIVLLYGFNAFKGPITPETVEQPVDTNFVPRVIPHIEQRETITQEIPQKPTIPSVPSEPSKLISQEPPAITPLAPKPAPSEFKTLQDLPVVKGETVSTSSGLNFEEQEIVKIYLNRVYTVLSAKIRDRVLRLNIPDHDKAEILKEFVHLDEQQQEEFLEEFEVLNQKVPPEFVGRILRLEIPKHQKDKLVEQLEYMSVEDQAEFVAEMERTVQGMG